MKRKTKARIFRSVILIILISSLLLTGCGQDTPEKYEDKPLAVGFAQGISDPRPPNFCAYKSDTSLFDIDNVEVTFCFGGRYNNGIEYELRESQSFPVFDIYFSNEYGDKVHVKHVEENFVSEKYNCKTKYDEKNEVTRIEFNHSEKFTIPKELFKENNGVIHFTIEGVDARVEELLQTPQEPSYITGENIYYKIIEDKVVLLNVVDYYLGDD